MATKKATPKQKKPTAKRKPPRSAGRPTKFDAECQERFIEAVREGLPYSTACALANIADSTWANWRHRAEAEPDSPYFAFLQAVKAAEGQRKRSEMAINQANRQQPNVAGIMQSAKAGGGDSGASGTMLTGPTGVDPNALALGKSTLLGS